MSSVLGETAVVIGNVTGTGDFEVRGRVQGSVEVRGRVLVAETGTVLGNVQATDIFIAGEVRGDLSAAEGVEVQALGRVEGNIEAPRVGIEVGARVRGMLRTGGELPQVAEKPAKKSAGHSKKRRRKGSESKGDSSPKHEQDREEFRGETAANVEPDTARANQATDGRGGSREDARVTSAEPRSDGPKNERPKGRKSRRRKGPPQLVTFVKGSKGHQRGPAS